jgi:uncharacterized protein (TIGR02217 family)
MAFHEHRLPVDIERRATGGLGFLTTINALASGFEKRNIEWSRIRGEWNLLPAVLRWRNDPAVLRSTIEAIVNLHVIQEGRAHGFRYRDWLNYLIGDPDDPTTDNQEIGTADGIQDTFQAFKRYSFGAVTYDRTIVKLVSGRAVVLIDDVVQSGNHTIDHDTGQIVFSPIPGSGSVQLACEYDTPVRFDFDRPQISADPAMLARAGPMRIVEDRLA